MNSTSVLMAAILIGTAAVPAFAQKAQVNAPAGGANSSGYSAQQFPPAPVANSAAPAAPNTPQVSPPAPPPQPK
jgi:hypothetical protein